MTTNGVTPCQDAYDIEHISELLPFGELVLTPGARTKTGTKASDADDRTKATGTSSSLKAVDRLHIRTDVPFLKLVQGLGLVRSSRPPTVTLDAPTVDEAGATLRAGGSSSAGARASTIPPEPTAARDGRK